MNEYEELKDFMEFRDRIKSMHDELMSYPVCERTAIIMELMAVMISVIGDTYRAAEKEEKA